jgi:heme A synthase
MFWVFVAIGFYAVTRSFSLPGFGSHRAVAVVVFVLGSLACGAGVDPKAVTRHGVTTPAVAALRAAGIVLLAIGIAAVVTGSAATLTAFVIGIGAIWLATVTRHVLSASGSIKEPEREPEPERVHVGGGR